VTPTHSSRTSRLSALIAGAGAVAAIAMLATPGASAKVTSAGGLDYVTTKASTEPGEQTRARADCPGGTHPIGGGTSVSGGFGEQQLVGYTPVDRGDEDEKPDDAWVGDADNFSPPQKTMKTFAICGAATYDYWTGVSYSLTAGDHSQVGFGYCQDPLHAVSGGIGYIAGGFDTVHLVRSQSTDDPAEPGIERDDGWYVGAMNGGPSQVGISARMVCAKGDYAYAEQVFTAAGNARTSATATCPKSMHVVGGAVVSAASASEMSLSASRPVDGTDPDRAPDDGWKVGIDKQDQFTASATAYATCQA
jgi:hypothetical protein